MIRINLLREELRKPPSLMWQFWLYVGTVVLVIGCAGYIHWTQTGKINKLEQEKARLNREAKMYAKYEKLLKDFKKKKAELDRKKAIVAQLVRDRDNVVRLLALLTVEVPEGKVWIERLTFSDNKATIRGYAKNDESVVEFIRSLESTPYVGRDRVNLVRTETKVYHGVGLKQFEMNFPVKPYSSILMAEKGM